MRFLILNIVIFCCINLYSNEKAKNYHKLGNIKIKSDYASFDLKKKVIFFKGRIHLVFNENEELFAEEIIINREDNVFMTRGKTIIKNKQGSIETENPVHGNIEKATYQITKIKGDVLFWTFYGEEIKKSISESTIKNLKISSCKHFKTSLNSFYFKTQEIKLKEKEQKIHFYRSWFYLYNIPLLYIPYFYYSLDEKQFPLRLKIDYNSKIGLEIDLLYKLYDRNISYGINIRSKRGLLFKTTLSKKNPKGDFAFFHTIFGQDENIQYDYIRQGRKFSGVSEVQRLRYLIDWKNKHSINKYLEFRSKINIISENHTNNNYLGSFSENFNQVYSYLNLDFNYKDINANFYFRPKINPFYTVIKKRPQLELQTAKINLGKNFFIKTKKSFANSKTSFRNIYFQNDEQQNIELHQDYSSNIFNLQIDLFFQKNLFSFLNTSIYVSNNYDYYSNSSSIEVNSEDINQNSYLDDPFRVPTESFINHQANNLNYQQLTREIGSKISLLLYKKYYRNEFLYHEHKIIPSIHFYSQSITNYTQNRFPLYFEINNLHTSQEVIKFSITQEISKIFLDKDKNILKEEKFFVLNNSIIRNNATLEKKYFFANQLLLTSNKDRIFFYMDNIYDSHTKKIQATFYEFNLKLNKKLRIFSSYFFQREWQWELNSSFVYKESINDYLPNSTFQYQHLRQIDSGIIFENKNLIIKLSNQRDLIEGVNYGYSLDSVYKTNCIDYKIGISREADNNELNFSIAIYLKHLKL